ncbi:transglycosylase SLT domain-containing protein [Methylobacterium sp. sgz302541]|uniref:transglycosylase SLT domain-containing protein n=1 Tax=unclassified Methylobacterium TaxID=2615210 RepID=UPI003D3549BA
MSRALLRGLVAVGLLAGIALGSGGEVFAHDRLDESAAGAQALEGGAADRLADWRGVPLLEQVPATTTIIEGSLAALPKPQADGAASEEVRFGDTSVPRRVVESILRASSETGVDPVYLMALADKESRFDAGARNPASSAEGLFQFVTATWLEMMRDYGARHGLAAEAASVTGKGGAIAIPDTALRARVLGLRRDPYVSAVMAAELVKRDRSRVESQIGRELSTPELYLAHFLGSASARRFLALSSDKPDEIARDAFRNAARSNRSLFVGKVEGAPEKAAGKSGGKSGGKNAGKSVRALTVAELHQRLDGMIDKRLSRFEGVGALSPAPEEPAAPPARPRILVTEALDP